MPRAWPLAIAVLFLAAGSLFSQERGDLFARLDANKDGYVTADEVQEPQKGLFDRLVRGSDKDGDGKLSQDEFRSGLGPGDGPRPERREGPPEGRQFGGPGGNPQFFEAMFDRTDKNSDGKLTKDEIPEERPGMRMIFDRVGSDSVTKEQFVRGMMAMSDALNQRPGPEGRPRPDGAPPRPGEGPGRRGGGPPGMRPPGGGLFAALDTDRDGQLSNEEIVGAGLALLKLDRNSDGRVSPEEAFGPPGPPRDRGPGERGPGERGRGGDRPGERRPEGAPGFGRGNFSPEAFRDRLKEADENKDGKLSKDEAPPQVRERFDRADANSDGFLDETEIRELLSRMGRGRNPENPGNPDREGDRPRGKSGDNPRDKSGDNPRGKSGDK